MARDNRIEAILQNLADQGIEPEDLAEHQGPLKSLTLSSWRLILLTAWLEARRIKNSLGLRVAAGYLRNRGVPLATALYWLTGSVRQV